METRRGRHRQLKLLAASLAEVPPPRPPFKVVPLVELPCPQGRGSTVPSPGAARTSPVCDRHPWVLQEGRGGSCQPYREPRGELGAPSSAPQNPPPVSYRWRAQGERVCQEEKLIALCCEGLHRPRYFPTDTQQPPNLSPPSGPRSSNRTPQPSALLVELPSCKPQSRAATLFHKNQRRGAEERGVPLGTRSPSHRPGRDPPLSYLSCPPRSAPAQPAAGCGQGSGSPSAAGASGSSCRGSGAPKVRGSEAPGLPSSGAPRSAGREPAAPPRGPGRAGRLARGCSPPPPPPPPSLPPLLASWHLSISSALPRAPFCSGRP